MAKRRQYQKQVSGQGSNLPANQQSGRGQQWTQSGRSQMNRGAGQPGVLEIDYAHGIAYIPTGFQAAYQGGGRGSGSQAPITQQGRTQQTGGGRRNQAITNPDQAWSSILQGNQRLANFLQTHSQQLLQATRTLQTQMGGSLPTQGRSSKGRRQKQGAY